MQSNVSSSDEGFLDRVGEYEENRSCSRTVNSTASSAFKHRAAMLESLLKHRLSQQCQTQSQTPVQNLPQRAMTRELDETDVRQVQPRENNDDYGHIEYVGPDSQVSFVKEKAEDAQGRESNALIKSSGTGDRRKKAAMNGPNHITRSQSCLVSRKTEDICQRVIIMG